MPQLAFVTTCKGRLDHLKQTLPLMTAQNDAECVVVDYGCPQGTADWVAANYPSVRSIRVEDDPGFCVGRARNLGAQATTAPWLCFVDADIRLAASFTDAVVPMLLGQVWLRANPATLETYGTCICRRIDFDHIGGYDETFRHWGGEDEDLYLRLNRAGCAGLAFPGTLLSAISHSDDRRVAFRELKDRSAGQRAHVLYTAAKLDLLQQGAGELLTPEFKERLYREATVAAQRASPPYTLNLSMPFAFPNLEHFGMTLTRQLSYHLDAQLTKK